MIISNPKFTKVPPQNPAGISKKTRKPASISEETAMISKGNKMRVLLADDDLKVRSALRLVLEQESAIEIIGEVEDSDELRLLSTQTGFDLVLLDWELPGTLRADHVLTELHSLPRPIRVVVLSGRPQIRALALALGADDFICKGDPPEQLLSKVLNSET
jgi:DNA-binding NarL/FixJ family response regulator